MSTDAGSRDTASAHRRLFVYGTLAPGEVNAHVLAPLEGEWLDASVRGTLHAEGWGQTYGFPALRLDASAAPVKGLIFQSDDLPSHWPELDAFEGSAYRRVEAEARLADGSSASTFIYVLNED